MTTDPVITSYTDSQITLTWTALTGTASGNSDILSYNVYWNDGTGSPATLPITDSNVLTATYSGLKQGALYIFKVRARNIYDYAAVTDFSNPVSVTTIDIPGKMAIPTVTLSSTTVTVTWVQPSAHSSTITSYDLEFLKSDGTFANYTLCTGTYDATVTLCSLAMTDVKTLTGLSVDTLIRAKVRARNAKDWGYFSELNSAGATIESIPLTMAAP